MLGGILLSSLVAISNASGNMSQKESISTPMNSFLTGNEDKKKDQSKDTFVLPTNNRQLNSKNEVIKCSARGYRNKDNFRTAILFHYGKLELMPEMGR